MLHCFEKQKEINTEADGFYSKWENNIKLTNANLTEKMGEVQKTYEKNMSQFTRNLSKRMSSIEKIIEIQNEFKESGVDKLEYEENNLSTILVMNKVDQRLLDELHTQFERLDADGSGGLQKDDLEILTQRKLSENRGCALKEYEQMLLEDRSLFSVNPQIVPSG